MKKTIGVFILIIVLSSMVRGFAEAMKVDLDLSTMPASIAYAQALAMQREPDNYLGVTVRIDGIFNYSEARQRGVVIIADTARCCETSMGFACAGDERYPEDYPELYTRFTVVGMFSICEDGEGLYQLADAVIESFSGMP